MLKILRADFYRLFKSRAMWVAWILSAVALLSYSLFCFIKERNYVLKLMLATIHNYAALFLICVFLEREFDSHSYKNLANKSVYAKFQYVCSKVIVILTVIVIFYLVQLLFHTVIGFAIYYKDYGWGVFVGINYPDGPRGWFDRQEMTLSKLLNEEAMLLLFTLAVAMFILALFTLIRNGIAVSAISLLYLAFASTLYQLISAILPISYEDIYSNTVVGNFVFRSWFYADYNHSLVYSAIFGVVATVFYFGLSWLFTCVREER